MSLSLLHAYSLTSQGDSWNDYREEVRVGGQGTYPDPWVRIIGWCEQFHLHMPSWHDNQKAKIHPAITHSFCLSILPFTHTALVHSASITCQTWFKWSAKLDIRDCYAHRPYHLVLLIAGEVLPPPLFPSNVFLVLSLSLFPLEHVRPRVEIFIKRFSLGL